MTIVPVAWIDAIVAGVLGNHLWQSALLVPVALLLSLILRRHAARTRYALWLTLSLKFLFPFAPLIALGRWLASGRPAMVQPHVMFIISTAMQPVSWPESQVTLPNPGPTPSGGHLLIFLVFLLWACGASAIVLAWSARWWRLASMVRRTVPLCDGRELAILRRVESSMRMRRRTPIVPIIANLEPGVFGFLRPVLLWPRGLSSRLSDAQIAAIFSHELCHLRRRDNLAAALHMVVQLMFWMHPLVWWLQGRLVQEREQACDDEVLRLGHDPHVYAEAIIKTCQFYLESPIPCVAGVTGSDLQARIVRLMSLPSSTPVAAWKKVILGAVTVVLIAAPGVVGFLTAKAPPTRPSTTNSSAAPFNVISGSHHSTADGSATGVGIHGPHHISR